MRTTPQPQAHAAPAMRPLRDMRLTHRHSLSHGRGVRRGALLLLMAAGMSAGASNAAGQSLYERRKAELEERQVETRGVIQSLDQRIQSTSSRLNQASREYDRMYKTYQELSILITLQNRKVNEIRSEVRQTGERIALTTRNLRMLEQELARLMRDYRASLTHLYKYGRTNTLALLFTSTSINHLLVRASYLRRYESYRESQVDRIQETRSQLEAALADLSAAKARSGDLLAELESESRTLAAKEGNLDRQIRLLQRNQKQLSSQLASFRKEQEQLNSTLTALSRQEDELREAERQRQKMLASAREIGAGAGAGAGDDPSVQGAAAAGGDGGVTPGPSSSPAVRALRDETTAGELDLYENRFLSAKGKLPWPVDNGVVTTKFGLQVHPVFKTRVENLGVDISADEASPVKAVSDGVVYAIQPLQGYGDVIFINHGQYKTAYGNLSSVEVARNQTVRAGQMVGRSGTRNSARGEVVFFLVRDGSRNVNPELWLE